MASVIILGLVLAVLAAVVMARAATTYNVTSNDRSWEDALFVAEAASQVGLSELATDRDFSTPEAAADVDTRAALIDAADARPASDIIKTPEGEAIIIKPPDMETVFAVGFTPSRDAVNRKIRVVEIEYRDYKTGAFPINGAIVANGDVLIRGTSLTSTIPDSAHTASAHTNGSFWGTDDGFVDGSVTSVSDIRMGDRFSIWDPDNPRGESGVDPVAFPAPWVIDEWEADLKAAAQEGPTYGSLILGRTETRTLDTPAYIAGDIVLSRRAKLVFRGDGPVYVAGSVFLQDDVALSFTGTLAVAGIFDMKGNANYITTGSPGESMLVSFATSSPAIALKGTADAAQQGMVYAARGGIEVKENAVFRGGLVAAGNIEIKGGASLTYPDGLASNLATAPLEELDVVRSKEL